MGIASSDFSLVCCCVLHLPGSPGGSPIFFMDCFTGGGRKTAYPDIEERLLQWMVERRDKGARVTGTSLRQECLKLHRQYGSQSFKASTGWFRRFKKRHNILFRRSTHISQQAADITDERVQRFLRSVIRMRKMREYDLRLMGNMDETPVWLEMPGTSTMDFEGAKSVSMSSTGQHKKRFTCILAGLSDRTKLPIMVLLPGVRAPKLEDIPAGVIIHVWYGKVLVQCRDHQDMAESCVGPEQTRTSPPHLGLFPRQVLIQTSA